MSSFQPSSEFSNAATYMSTSGPSGLSNDVKLKLYGLYKLVTEGTKPKTSRPSFFDMAGRAKWDSWAAMYSKFAGNESAAQEEYINIAKECGWTGEEPHDSIVKQSSQREEDLSAEELLSRETPERELNATGAGAGPVVSTVSADDEGEEVEGLHKFANLGHATELRKYLEENKDVDVNAFDNHGFTPLHLACDRGHSEVVKILLNFGADISLKDEDGLTAEELASENDEIMSIIKSHKPVSTIV